MYGLSEKLSFFIHGTMQVLQNFGKIDYIGIWFVKGAYYVSASKAKCAFVSTNSICQGEMVEPLWDIVFMQGASISFAYTSFKWNNNAKKNAAVYCVIIGLDSVGKGKKLLYTKEGMRQVGNITPYLTDGNCGIISKVTSPISDFPNINRGCMPYDGGNLIMDSEEMKQLISDYPQAARWIKELYSGADFIKGITRYCLWISEKEYQEAVKIKPIEVRIMKTKEMRMESSDEGARKLAEKPYQFREFNKCTENTLVIPSTSSSNRRYIPMGYATDSMIVNNAMYMIDNANLWVFGVITSEMNMLWVNTIGGKLKMDYRYTNLCYNTFPFPTISDTKKSEIEEAATEVLLARENYPDKTLADLYDPDKMPGDLRAAHENLDRIVESCYPGAPFPNDEARLECLFKLYEKMTANKKR